MIIDLGENAPHIECKLGSKTYQVYADDTNLKVIDDIVGLYADYQKESTEISKRFDALEKDQAGVKPLTSTDYKDYSNNLLKQLKTKITGAFDLLLDEPGVGSKIWKAKHDSTEYLMFALSQIQTQLQAEKDKFENDKANVLKQEYNVHNAVPISRNKRRNKQK